MRVTPRARKANDGLLHMSAYSDAMEMIIEHNVLPRSTELIAQHADTNDAILLVSDPDTHASAGHIILSNIHSAFSSCAHYMLPSQPKATDALTVDIQHAAKESALIIAVGSGTINDLCKYASAQHGIPYIVFATAASMNGYASANASITVNGIKSTVPAQTPAGIYADLDVIAASPLRLTRAGLGDSLCRPTAQADWLLSQYVLGTHYDNTPFEWLVPFEAELFAHSERLNARDTGFMRLLMETLIASGKGMTQCGGSYPASQGEHLIAHTMEMLHVDLPQYLHGEEIGVTTLTMAQLQNELIKERPIIKAHSPALSHFVSVFGEHRGAPLHQQFQTKELSHEQAESLNDMLAEKWPDISAHLREVMMPYETLRNVLERAGAYTAHSHLRWPTDTYNKAIDAAYLVRDRFTFLDVAAMKQ